LSQYSLIDRIMARPLSDEKRKLILTAATSAVASLGTAASTAKIAKDAGVGEGTLFVYFPTKDDLLSQLYLDLRRTIPESWTNTSGLAGKRSGARYRPHNLGIFLFVINECVLTHL
jgi:Bacterial regulatory proteins, tetR family